VYETKAQEYEIEEQLTYENEAHPLFGTNNFEINYSVSFREIPFVLVL